MTDLNFVALQPPSTALAFGEAGGHEVYIDITLTAVLASAPMTASLTTNIDNAVSRGPASRTGAAWRRASPASQSVAVEHRIGSRREGVVSQPMTDGQRLSVGCDAGWGAFGHLTAAPSAAWQEATRNATVSAELWANLSPRLRPGLRAVFEAGTPRAVRASDTWITLHRDQRPAPVLPWGEGRSLAARASNPFSVATRHRRNTRFPWGEATWPAAGVSEHGGAVQPPEPPCYIPPAGNAVVLAFRALQPATFDIVFKCPDADGPAATVVVPVRSVYMQTNTVTLVLAESGQPIPARDLQLSLDVDTWCWGWSARVPASYLSALQAPFGDLVEVIATVNGSPFRLAVERVQRDRSFGAAQLAVSGRGRAAWLADPHAPVVSRSNAAPMTAQQLMADALTENGVPIGWDIDWQITDWAVPAGAWQHTGTAMEACLAIAEAAGAYIHAHPTDQILCVLPRYPAAPWTWGSLTPDIELPEAACEVEGVEWVDKPDYNTVFISGQSGGILGHVTRQGTAGDKPAPMISDPLNTHADAARQRGTAILSDTGRQKHVTLSLQVLPETGIIMPGKLLRYVESGATHIGLTRGVEISHDFPKLRQTITVESHDI